MQADKSQNVRLRSANRGNANNTWNVSASGFINNNNAYNGNRCAPDCVYSRDVRTARKAVALIHLYTRSLDPGPIWANNIRSTQSAQ